MNQENPRQPRYGSSLASMFGYVTDEDRAQWESQRARNAPKVSAARAAFGAAGGALGDFAERNINSQLSAAHRVAAQQEFDEDHTKTSTPAPGKRGAHTENIDYSARDDRVVIEPAFEL